MTQLPLLLIKHELMNIKLLLIVFSGSLPIGQLYMADFDKQFAFNTLLTSV